MNSEFLGVAVACILFLLGIAGIFAWTMRARQSANAAIREQAAAFRQLEEKLGLECRGGGDLSHPVAGEIAVAPELRGRYRNHQLRLYVDVESGATDGPSETRLVLAVELDAPECARLLADGVAERSLRGWFTSLRGLRRGVPPPLRFSCRAAWICDGWLHLLPNGDRTGAAAFFSTLVLVRDPLALERLIGQTLDWVERA